MIHSLLDTSVGEQEFKKMNEQGHFEKVWEIMQPELENYSDRFFESITRKNSIIDAKSNFSLYIQELIKSNEKLKEKYDTLFSLDAMEEYESDPDGFKAVILKKDTDVIKNILMSKSKVLNEWKSKFYASKARILLDTFQNLTSFGGDYDGLMDEQVLNEVNSIKDTNLSVMIDEGCYLSGVIGTGILANILNHMYPRIFPGNFKIGMFSLYFLSGRAGIEMGSRSSEFLMVKDDMHSKTGIFESDHNYYFSYDVFALYSLRIYRYLENKANERFGMIFPRDYRYLLTNSYFNFIGDENKESIQTLLGNDDILKFTLPL